MPDIIKPEKLNWKHYFGGFGLITIILQLITGLYLIFFFEPTLKDAYTSIRYISNELFMGSLARNLHRWAPTLLMIATLIHTIRSFLRSDYKNPSKKVLWLTGVLLMMPIFLFLVTGLIVPWEWKGYWFMEMIPNYFETLPVVGPTLKTFFLESFTIPRYYVVHVVLLPLITIVLVDYHMLGKLRKRGIFRYILKHAIVTLPVILLLFALATNIPIPSNDPIEVPMPLEGEWILSPEWYFLTVFLPLMYLKGTWVPIMGIGLPLLIFFGLAFLPYFFKNEYTFGDQEDVVKRGPIGRFFEKLANTSMKKKVMTTVGVSFLTLFFCGLLYLGNYNSPTLGCNSCHNTSRGIRMGIPPETFLDRGKNPILENNEWMMGHWYYPNEIW